jgi:hypothetical protein
MIGDEELLEYLALEKALSLVSELRTELVGSTVVIKFSQSAHSNRLYFGAMPGNATLDDLVSKVLASIHWLIRSGINIEDDSEKNNTLLSMVKDCAENLITRNDFQDRTQFLSAVSSKSFDEMLNQIYPDRVVEYVSQFERGIAGLIKRIVYPDDLTSLNSTVSSVQIAGEKFPSTGEKRNDLIRRMAMIARDSDCCILISTAGTDPRDVPVNERWFMEIALYLAKPFYFLDASQQIWLSQSVSERRDFVKSSKLNFSRYKRIATYTNSSSLTIVWEQFKKSIQGL